MEIQIRQKVALSYPCARAKDTIAPRFREFTNGWSTILTVNK